MERTGFITHKGKNVLIIDLSNFKAKDLDEVLDILNEAGFLISQQPKNSVLSVMDVSGSSFNRDVVQALKNFSRDNKEYEKKVAVVGVGGLQKVIYAAVMRFSDRNVPIFNTVEEAKDYVVED